MIEDLMDALKNDGNDVDGTMVRFMNRTAMYEKYLRKYLDDPCFDTLTTALKDGEVEEAFKASHTLKGVSSNLGLTNLYNADVVIVEKLRNNIVDDLQGDYDAIAIEHRKIIGMIKEHLDV